MANRAETSTGRETLKRIRACSINLSSTSSLVGNLQWSKLGQALVVTDNAIFILSPLTGLHPTLAGQSRTQDVECHPDWEGRFPHSVNQINIKTFLQNETVTRKRSILESDHTAVDPRYLNPQWCSAIWSRPGMGPHNSCLIIATTSEHDLFVLGAPTNAWTGEWQLFHSVDLSPVVEITELQSAPSSHAHDPSNFNQDDGGLSPARALLRKKQLATEVLCADIVHDEGLRKSAYIVAGTKAGQIAVWKCQPITGHCSFLTATSVSRTGIHQLMTSWVTEISKSTSRARIAFQDGDGVRLCDLHLSDDNARLTLSEQAPLQVGRCTLSAWDLFGLIYATPGQVHVFDTRTGKTISFDLATDPDSNRDPFSPVIGINERSELKVVLADLRQYEIPTFVFRDSYTQPPPTSLEAVNPPRLVGYPPLTEALQRKHDQFQVFLGYQKDPAWRLESTTIVGAICTNERVAFLGYNVSETLRYQMEVTRDDTVKASDLLNKAITCVGLNPPFLLARNILAVLYTSDKPEVFRDQLLSEVEYRLTEELDGPVDPLYRRGELLYLLALALGGSSLPPGGTSRLSRLMKQYKESVLSKWIQDWHTELSRSFSMQATDQDKELLARLAYAVRMLTPGTHWVPGLPFQRRALKPLPTNESCGACDTQLTMQWDDDEQSFGWARCQNGHIWPRCSVTLATISDREVRVCTGCWAKALLPDRSTQGSWQAKMLKAARNCLYCGSCWIVR